MGDGDLKIVALGRDEQLTPSDDTFGPKELVAPAVLHACMHSALKQLQL